MNSNILTLEQMQNMSIDEMTEAYRNGYVLSENSDVYSATNLPQTYSATNIPQIYSATNGSHYTMTDMGVIAGAIGISVGLLGLLTWYIIRKEEDRIILQIKQAVASATEKASIFEKLLPIAQRIGERLLPPKA